MIDNNLLIEFVDKTLEKRELKRKERKIEQRLRELTEEIIEQFEEEEIIESIRVKGYNVRPQRQLWAGCIDGDFERACNALVQSGHGDYVNRRFDGRSVSALIREYDERGDIPDELKNNLSITEKYVLSLTKGPAKKG